MVSHTLLVFISALLGISIVSASSGGSYPRCIRTGRRTGMAHYRGWKIVGEDVSLSRVYELASDGQDSRIINSGLGEELYTGMLEIWE